MTSRRLVALLATALVTVTMGAGCSRGKVPAADESSAESSRPVAADTTTTTTTTAPSDEDQVRDAVMAFQDAYNTQNWDAYLDSMCPSWRAQYTGPVMDLTKKTRVDQGLTTVNVTSVRIVGDEATATVDAQNELLGRKTLDFLLVREDGWRMCMPNGVR